MSSEHTPRHITWSTLIRPSIHAGLTHGGGGGMFDTMQHLGYTSLHRDPEMSVYYVK